MTHYAALLAIRAYLAIEIDKLGHLHYGHAEHGIKRGHYYIVRMIDCMDQYTKIGRQLDKMEPDKVPEL